MTSEIELSRRALEMRRNPTEPEKRMWRYLSNAQLEGYKFRRQHVVLAANVIVDFFCPSIGLAIEVDGDTHDPERDDRRDERLNKLGFSVLHFGNADVMSNAGGVVEVILAKCRSLPSRWAKRHSPHPNPSPEGEGL
jgi:very-short-patch-repair endonuclease